MSRTIINKDLELELIELYCVVDPANDEIVTSCETNEAAEDYIRRSNRKNLYIEFSTNKEIVNKLNEKYSGCKLYFVVLEDGSLKVASVENFNAFNDLNYNFVSSNKNGAMLIAHNEDEAIELTKSYFEKLDNNEPIDIPVRDF